MESKTKKKLATAVAGVAMVGAAVSVTAGTFSYFSDSATSSVQRVSTGSLKIGTTIEDPINLSDAIPGWEQTTTFTVTNKGTVDGYLTLSVIDKGSDQEMLSGVHLTVDHLGSGTLGQIEKYTKNGISFPDAIAPGATATFTVHASIPNDKNGSQNDLQSKVAKAAVQAELKSLSQSWLKAEVTASTRC